MHEISLGGTVHDYLSGNEVPNTTYEDVRQALARMLVEEKGYPREQLRSKVAISFPIHDRGEDKTYTRVVDIVAYDAHGRPLLVLIFCSGGPSSYDRETVAAARLIENGPAPLALVTDTQDAVLLDVRSGETIRRGLPAVLDWDELVAEAAQRNPEPLTGKRLEGERRILYTYSEILAGCCTESAWGCGAGDDSQSDGA